MPPPPKPQWSEAVNGLRCGLSLDPEKVTIGEQLVAQLKFENTTDKPISFYNKVEGAADRFVIYNDSGIELRLQAARGTRLSRRRRGGSSSLQTIAPGQTFETQVEGKIVAASDGAEFNAGQFHAVYNLETNERTPAGLEPTPTRAAWTGKVSSGAFLVSVTSPEKESCVDCHGGADYHHVKIQECTNCHVGEVGKPDFGLEPEACGHCHRREGVFGRRTILGPDGEFSMASRHIRGTIHEKQCLVCHDHSKHGDGVVNLIDPDSGGKDPWTGSRTDFCLACHDGDPPEGVTLPDKFDGSGFDKMMFLGSKLSQTKEGCSYCHAPHGSPLPSLLKNPHSPE
ncbi:MAG: multiheme c-type cytochrome [Planctomycetota bacterium]